MSEDHSLARERALDVLQGVGGSIIPIVGGAMAALLAGDRQRALQADYEAHLEELADTLTDAFSPQRLDELFSTEQFRAHFIKVATATAETGELEKRRLLHRALVAGYSKDMEADELNNFLEVVVRYQPVQVTRLQFQIWGLMLPWFDQMDFQQRFKFDNDTQWADALLVADGFLNQDQRVVSIASKGMLGENAGAGAEGLKATERGRRFLDFLGLTPDQA